MSANDRQHGGDHYRSKPIQVWDFVHRNGIGYLAGNAIKYLARYQDKGGKEDVLKARHYVEKLLEEEYGVAPDPTPSPAPPCDHEYDVFGRIGPDGHKHYIEVCVKCFQPKGKS